jgi:Radial spokehead-like protein
MLEAIGTGLDLDEMYSVALQAKRLSENFNVTSVRFFGKMFGIIADYYVFEAMPRERAPVVPETSAGATWSGSPPSCARPPLLTAVW